MLAGARRLALSELTEAGVGPRGVRPRVMPEIGDCIGGVGEGQGVDNQNLVPSGGQGLRYPLELLNSGRITSCAADWERRLSAGSPRARPDAGLAASNSPDARKTQPNQSQAWRLRRRRSGLGSERAKRHNLSATNPLRIQLIIQAHDNE